MCNVIQLTFYACEVDHSSNVIIITAGNAEEDEREKINRRARKSAYSVLPSPIRSFTVSAAFKNSSTGSPSLAAEEYDSNFGSLDRAYLPISLSYLSLCHVQYSAIERIRMRSRSQRICVLGHRKQLSVVGS